MCLNSSSCKDFFTTKNIKKNANFNVTAIIGKIMLKIYVLN